MTRTYSHIYKYRRDKYAPMPNDPMYDWLTVKLQELRTELDSIQNNRQYAQRRAVIHEEMAYIKVQRARFKNTTSDCADYGLF